MEKPPAEAILSIAVIIQFVMIWVLARRLSDSRSRQEETRSDRSQSTTGARDA